MNQKIEQKLICEEPGCGKEIDPKDGYYASPIIRCAECGEIAYSHFNGGFSL